MMSKVLFFLFFLCFCGHFVLLQSFLPERPAKKHWPQQQQQQHRQTTTATTLLLQPKGNKENNNDDGSNDKPEDKIKIADNVLDTTAASEAKAKVDDQVLKHFLDQHRTALLNSIEAVRQLVNNEDEVNALLNIIKGDNPVEALREVISKDKKRAAAAATSKRTSTPEEQEQGEGVGAIDFINHLIDTISDKDWERFELKVDNGQEFLSTLTGRRKAKDEMKKMIIDNFETKEIIEVEAQVKNTDESVRKNRVYRPPFKLQAIDDDWIEKKGAVLEFLKNTTSDVLEPSGNDGLSSFDISEDLVEYEPNDVDSFLSYSQIDKAHAAVIAGESGSGKTVFSCFAAKQHGFQVFYCALEPQDFGPNKKFPQRECTEWHDFILCVICYLRDLKDRPTDVPYIIELLYDIKSKLNSKRNNWAWKIAERALERTLPGDSRIKDWFDGTYAPSNRPEKVAIVLDEATDQNFARGMVDIVRKFIAKHRGLARNEVILILAGTGLDAISFDNMKRLGTNPSKSKLIMMKRPNIAKVINTVSSKKHPNVLKQSIEAGLLSRVLSQNSRMFFRAVLPIMLLDIFYKDDKFDISMAESRLRERLIEVGSFRPLMDYGVRYYVGSNSISTLTVAQRSMLLKQAFSYHLLKSMVDALSCMDDADLKSKKKSESKKESELKEESKPKNDSTLTTALTDELHRVLEFEPCVRPLIENEDISFKQLLLDNNSNKDIVVPKPDEFMELVSASDIFVYGLASVRGTSNALKYMSCFGLTHRLRAGFGDTLEVMVAMHVARYAEIQGYNPVLIELKHGWPHKSSKGNKNITEKVICDLKQELDRMYKNEQNHLNSTTSSFSGKECFILSQGAPTAQGPDIFAVYIIDKTSAMLDLIQCKHFQKAPSAGNMRQWWWSLGIGFDDEEKRYVEEPKVGSAGYSYAGIESLRDCLSKWLKKEVAIGRRIIATSLDASSLDNFDIPKCGTVWCKELLEPTISILPANSSYAEDDIQKAPAAKMDPMLI